MIYTFTPPKIGSCDKPDFPPISKVILYIAASIPFALNLNLILHFLSLFSKMCNCLLTKAVDASLPSAIDEYLNQVKTNQVPTAQKSYTKNFRLMIEIPK